MPMGSEWGPVALLLAGIAALALVGTLDAQDAERAQNTYCKMVELWDSDATQGMAPEQRRGWPPFDGRKQCETEE